MLSSRFLAVVGTSGSGKSSLVRSGLLPALNRDQIFGSETSWKTVVFRPGNDPLVNLSTALAQSLFRNQPAENPNFWEQSVTEAIITHQNNGLLRVVQQAGLKAQDKLVIVVDQFEELFRFSDKHVNNFDIQKDVDGLINILLESVSQTEIPIYVVLTMRYDFLGRCTDYDGLPEVINQGTYLVPRMTREGRKRAIEEPIKTNRVTISP
ncbi:MAG: AAA family ATPase, partial [Bacteroidetes bacterium]|nr:AAA family ATPase [Bacteroidota bacterium]